MFYYDRIDVCEVFDVDESITSKESIVCPYRYFSKK